jgi:hypothetical protein
VICVIYFPFNEVCAENFPAKLSCYVLVKELLLSAERNKDAKTRVACFSATNE